MVKHTFKTVFFFVVLFATLSFAEFYLNVGTVQIGNENYMIYEFGPEFTVGPLTLGLTLTTYATDLTTGSFYFGYPGSSAPSTNILDGINITAFGLDLGNIWFRYGRMRPITYGMGFIFSGYSNPNARTLDAGIRMGMLSASAHVPYQLAQLSTFTFTQSDSVYTAVVSSKVSLFELSVYGGVDMDGLKEDAVATPLTYAAGVSLTTNVLGFSVGAEAGAQMWKDGTTGYGAFGGIFGDFGVLQFVAGPFYASDGFKPWLISRNYGFEKSQPDFGPDKYKSDLGYIANLALTFSPYGKVAVLLKGNFEGNMTLSGEGLINIPAIGGTNGLVLYGYLYDETPFENEQFFDDNTQARLTIAYPVFSGFYAGVKYIWEDSQWKQTAFVGGTANF